MPLQPVGAVRPLQIRGFMCSPKIPPFDLARAVINLDHMEALKMDLVYDANKWFGMPTEAGWPRERNDQYDQALNELHNARKYLEFFRKRWS